MCNFLPIFPSPLLSILQNPWDLGSIAQFPSLGVLAIASASCFLFGFLAGSFSKRKAPQKELNTQNIELVKENSALKAEIQERTAIEKELREKDERSRQQQVGLLAIAQSPHLYDGNLAAVLEETTQLACQTLEVERASVWFYNSDQSAIECVKLYELSSGQHSEGTRLSVADYPSYFQALATDRAVDAHQAHHDPRTLEFRDSYLLPSGITSMLDVAIHLKGKIAGVLCLEHVGSPRQWSVEERNFASYLGYAIALAKEAGDRASVERLLKQQAARDSLLGQIAQHFINQDIHGAIHFALKGIGKITRSDRSYVMRYAETQNHFSNTHEWCAPGIQPFIDELQEIPAETFPWFDRHHRAGKVLRVASAAELPPEAAAEKAELERESIQSLLLVPIHHLDRTIGFIGLDSVRGRKDWTQEEITLLRRVGEIIAIAEARQQAEQKLQQRNRELARTLEELKTTQTELIQSEKMAALGQLVAGVAHEVNNPLGAIRASANNTAVALSQCLRQLPQLGQRLDSSQQAHFFTLVARSLRNTAQLTAREQRQCKREIARQLHGGGIENPRRIADTLTDMGICDEIEPYLDLLQRPDADWAIELAYNLTRLHGNARNILNAVERASKIVFALKNYARYNRQGNKQLAQVTEGLETVLKLYESQLNQRIEVICNYQPVPAIDCYPDELVQVWTNLLHNAIHAMAGRGTIHLDVFSQGDRSFGAALRDRVVVRITDSGCGIPPEIQGRIFEPFFTTKPAGEGSGLGLDIVRKIIEKHQGEIEVISRPGRTTFSVWLPVENPTQSVKTSSLAAPSRAKQCRVAPI